MGGREPRLRCQADAPPRDPDRSRHRRELARSCRERSRNLPGETSKEGEHVGVPRRPVPRRRDIGHGVGTDDNAMATDHAGSCLPSDDRRGFLAAHFDAMLGCAKQKERRAIALASGDGWSSNRQVARVLVTTTAPAFSSCSKHAVPGKPTTPRVHQLYVSGAHWQVLSRPAKRSWGGPPQS